MRWIVVVALAAGLSACGGGGDASDAGESPSAQKPISVFIFAGQSNLFGADAIIDTSGAVRDLVDMGQQTDVDRSALFTMATPYSSYAWGDIRGHDGSWLGDLTVNGKPVKVHGPEVGFNREVGGGVAIVKYGNNYTELEGGRSAWVKPGTRWTAWQSFVDKQLVALGRPYKVAGVVWFQGIDDGRLGRTQEAYKADLVQVIADVRAKFGDVPVVIGRSVNSTIAGTAAMTPIRAAQVEVGAMRGNGWVNVDDLPLATEHHLSATGQLTAGQRFAEEYLLLK
jgi:hypothetical protein